MRRLGLVGGNLRKRRGFPAEQAGFEPAEGY